jgi:hypothetical protein
MFNNRIFGLNSCDFGLQHTVWVYLGSLVTCKQGGRRDYVENSADESIIISFESRSLSPFVLF